MAAKVVALFVATFAIVLATVAADPDELQDLCVADLTSGVKVNGFPCKANIVPDDFFFSGLANPAATNNNSFGAVVTPANVQKIPGLNTMGISMGRIDYAPGGVNPPHTHPRASEVIFVLEGQLEVGFITTANVLISKTLNKGDVFAFPRGLVHFQKNNGNVPASVIAAFDSQLPGTQQVITALFASNPAVPDNVLTGAFHLGSKQINRIKSRFAPKN
ncbi:hypothetical protein Tsubulata_023024 [Turnera subulata]|uniref:Germin-like protein n=1 Tax=Turnera subulata TaxID=218843 RepID=A0A9Q0FYW2_9ROSI|nr:hypothetical protein Tsubulata_023024 [Turnera subulata]